MNVDRWPHWVRWLLFLPAGILAMTVMQFVLTLVLLVNGDDVSLLGIGIEGAAARAIQTFWYEGLTRFLEPYAFVATAGLVAPARRAASIAVAAVMALLLVAICLAQLNRSGTAGAFVPIFRALIGVSGAVAAAVASIRDSNARA